MNWLWELNERQWVAQAADGPVEGAGFVVLDLEDPAPRGWLDAARERVELIGRGEGGPLDRLLGRAHDLDVDFLACPPALEDLDARKLPLRLVADEVFGEAGAGAGAAWARRVSGWGLQDSETLRELARAGRLFLGPGPDALPERSWLEAVGPFAVSVPEGWNAADLRAWEAS